MLHYQIKIIFSALGLVGVCVRAGRRRLIFLIYGTKLATFFERQPRRRYLLSSACDQTILNQVRES